VLLVKVQLQVLLSHELLRAHLHTHQQGG
jgi:hypothetical protein